MRHGPGRQVPIDWQTCSASAGSSRPFTYANITRSVNRIVGLDRQQAPPKSVILALLYPSGNDGESRLQSCKLARIEGRHPEAGVHQAIPARAPTVNQDDRRCAVPLAAEALDMS